MTLTARGCPMHVHISNDIKDKIGKVEGVEEVTVNVVWEPPWTPERITEDGKKILGYSS